MDRRGFLGGLLALVGASRLVKAEPRKWAPGPSRLMAKPGEPGYRCRIVFYNAETGLETPVTPHVAEIHRTVNWTQ